MPYLSPDQRDITDAGGVCYKTLFVGTSRDLDFCGGFRPESLQEARIKLSNFQQWHMQVIMPLMVHCNPLSEALVETECVSFI